MSAALKPPGGLSNPALISIYLFVIELFLHRQPSCTEGFVDCCDTTAAAGGFALKVKAGASLLEIKKTI